MKKGNNSSEGIECPDCPGDQYSAKNTVKIVSFYPQVWPLHFLLGIASGAYLKCILMHFPSNLLAQNP